MAGKVVFYNRKCSGGARTVTSVARRFAVFVFMVGPWSDHGRIMVGSWSDHGRIMVGSWSDHGRIMVGSWSDHGRIMVGSWSDRPHIGNDVSPVCRKFLPDVKWSFCVAGALVAPRVVNEVPYVMKTKFASLSA